MSQFTKDETETIRSAVMGAVALVSQAEPGFIATFKESMAASKALANAPQDFAELIKGGMTMPPTASSKEEMISKLLGNLREGIQVASKDPATLEAMKSYVSAACQEVASAAKGVSPEETAMIEQIQGVLNEAPSAQQPVEQPAQTTPAAPQAEAQAPAAPQAQAPAAPNGEATTADKLNWPTN